MASSYMVTAYLYEDYMWSRTETKMVSILMVDLLWRYRVHRAMGRIMILVIRYNRWSWRDKISIEHLRKNYELP